MSNPAFLFMHRVTAAAAALLPALAASQARLKQVTEDQTHTSGSGAASVVVEAHRLPGAGRPLLVAGNFRNSVAFPVPASVWHRGWNGTLTATPDVESVFLGILRQDAACGPSPSFAITHYPAANDYAISLTASAIEAPARRVPFDADGDGDTDIAVVNHVASGTPFTGVTVHYNDGAGNFPASTFYDWGNSDSGLFIAAGDLNGDAHPDLAATTDRSTLKVMLNDGKGVFFFAAEYPVGPSALAFADLDRDGDLDVATRGMDLITGLPQVRTLLNRGDGTFDPGPSTFVGEFGTSLAPADMDGDDEVDLVLDHGTKVRVLYNSGQANFSTASDLSAGPGNTESVLARDVNGDGRVDILASKSAQFYVLRNEGPPGFRTFPSSPTGLLEWMDLGDFDGDGDLDVAGTGPFFGGSRVTLARNDGDGVFAGDSDTIVGFVDLAPNVSAGDFNSDGIDDLAAVYVDGGSFPELHVLINTPAAQPPDDCLQWTAGPTDRFFEKLEPKWEGFIVVPPEPACEVRGMIADGADAYLAGPVTQTTYLADSNGGRYDLAAPLSIVNGRGYIASATNGDIHSAVLTDLDMRPAAIAKQDAPARLVVFGQQRDAGEDDFEGERALLQRYPIPVTSTPTDEIAASDDLKLRFMEAKAVVVTATDEAWIAGEVAGQAIEGTPPTGIPLGGLTDFWAGRADFAGQQLVDGFVFGSDGFDRWGAMKEGPNGEIFVAFNVNGRDVTFGPHTFDLDDPGLGASTGLHAFLGLITSDGSPGWVVPLAISRSDRSSFAATDIDIDSAGNAYVSFSANGTFTVRGAQTGYASTGQMVVDGTGRVVSHTPTPGVVAARATAVFDIENRLNLGFTAPPFVEGKASFASISSRPVAQTSYMLCWDDPNEPGNTADALDAFISQVGGQVHLISRYPALGKTCISAYLTEAQFNVISRIDRIKIEADPLIIEPDAGGHVSFETITGAGWALARLLDPFSNGDGPATRYHFPSGFVTSTSAARKVRVYVIDKGLAPAQQFAFPTFSQTGALPITYDGANGLCVDALAHQTDNGVLDPDTASEHPKQAVNLVGVAGLGSAQGTAMEFVGVDMYTGASTEDGNCLTYLSYVSHGILQAVSDAVERNLPPAKRSPSIIVIASSGLEPETRLGIEGAVEQALALNIPVIVSAGNDGSEVGGYLPARLGVMDGVITVGGIAQGSPANRNPLYADTNIDPSGDIISLFAPGEALPTGFGTSSGTSFSCALVAGLAATYLSMHPDATPAEVEQALVDASFKDPRGINLAQSTCSFAAWMSRHGLGDLLADADLGMALDSDGDGTSNLGEFLGGSHPGDPLDTPAPIPAGIDLRQTTVQISAWLPRELVSPGGVVGDSCMQFPVGIEVSEDLDRWRALDPALGTLSTGATAGPLEEIRFSVDRQFLDPRRTFLRFAFESPPAP